MGGLTRGRGDLGGKAGVKAGVKVGVKGVGRSGRGPLNGALPFRNDIRCPVQCLDA